MNKPTLTIKPFVHKGANVIQLRFEKNDDLLKLLRQINTLKWSQTMHCWYVPNVPEVKKYLYYIVQGHVWLNYEAFKKNPVITLAPTQPGDAKADYKYKIAEILPALSKDAELKIIEFRRWMQSRRYSQNTIGTYADALKTFLRFFASKPIVNISNDDLVHFNNDYIIKNKLSASFQNQTVNAIKLFFRTVEERRMETDLIHRPKRSKTLPNVLSKEEVKQILSAHNNIKHKTMLSLIYSCGLRCGELLRLKREHVDEKRGLLIVKQSKGRKDRVVPLSNKIIDLLNDYYVIAKPKNYLFEGQEAGEMYDERSLQNVLKQAVTKAGIGKPVSLHWLRHSYATHLLESGTDLRYIQEILGHSSSRTTEIYTHVSTKNIQKIISPFDYL